MMANIILGEKREEVKDGDNIRAACEELGVPFGCKKGVCGACKIIIEEGEDNLGPLTAKEEQMEDRDETHRLACQATIKSGTVTIKVETVDDEEDKEIDEHYLDEETSED